MWKEIGIDDKEGIDNIVSLWNSRLNCTFQMDKKVIERTLQRKRDAHYYIFEGIYLKILIGFKHDYTDDTTYIFNANSDAKYIDFNDTRAKSNEGWNAYQLLINMLLEKYERKVKLIKWEENKRIQSIVDKVVGFYAQYGIIATNFENHWLFELM